MRQYILIIISLFTVSCKTETVKEQFPIPNKAEIVTIVETIISENKIPVKKNSLQYHMPLMSDLEKLHVYLADTCIDEMGPPQMNELSMRRLLALKVKDRKFFSRGDSTFFLFQNDTLKTIDLDKELEVNYYLTTSKEQNTNEEKFTTYWSMSVPIFSKDLKKAYVVVNENCYGLCGSGGFYLLEKINNKWTIVDYQMLWIS
jgi:hypothetical protein